MMTWDGLTPPYRTIVVDPPWPQKGGGPLRGGHGEGFIGTAGSNPMPYSTMTVPEIAALPIRDLVGDQAHLYLWTTNWFLPDAFQVIASWGFTYSTTLVWAKTPIGAGLGGAYGIATEYVLFAHRGRVDAQARIGRNWFTWKRPYSYTGKPQHSGKPPAFLDMVEQVSPAPRVELFARAQRLGWDSWGSGYEAAFNREMFQ
jgi:N6-adenosine-specific RNA methylase IME4